MLSAIRFWTIMGLRVFDEVPNEYLPVQYGPRTAGDDDQVRVESTAEEASKVERARAVADELRAA